LVPVVPVALGRYPRTAYKVIPLLLAVLLALVVDAQMVAVLLMGMLAVLVVVPVVVPTRLVVLVQPVRVTLAVIVRV